MIRRKLIVMKHVLNVINVCKLWQNMFWFIINCVSLLKKTIKENCFDVKNWILCNSILVFEHDCYSLCIKCFWWNSNSSYVYLIVFNHILSLNINHLLRLQIEFSLISFICELNILHSYEYIHSSSYTFFNRFIVVVKLILN